jgi:hypothetical protein
MMDPSSLKEKIRNDPKALETFLEELLKDPSERTVDLLKELKELYKDHKECLKVVKRAIFKLRQKGVIFEEEEGKSVSILRPIKLPEPKGYLGLWDLSGRLFLALEKETPRGLIGLSGFGSFEEGLLDFFGGSVAKKNWRKFLENQVVSGIKPKEVPASYVKTLFEELEGIRSHEEFRKQASYLESLPSYEGPVPLVFQYLSLEGLNNPKEEKLFEILPHFGLWAFKEEELKPYMEELRRAQESPLVLTQTQKSQRIDGIVEKAIQGLFTEKRRQALRRNLQEVALILWLNDKKEEAENLLLLAERLKEEPSPLRPDPFLRRLFLLGLQALSSEKAPREVSSF